ncbi:MAG: DUF4465 domain-containing protein [Prevotellaceae bacterium]|jgi:hypothetical protein|nr:DUF4465 domain-containing protein [Prevotellaceae bacterium]
MAKKLFLAAFAVASLAALSCTKDDDSSPQDTATIAAYDTITVDFSDLTLSAGSHWDGSDGSGQFVSGIATFLNSYNADFSSWSGFAYSNQSDTSASSYTAQFDVYTASPSSRGVFAVGYMDTYATATYTPAIPTVTFTEQVALQSADFALNAYAYKSMRDGDGFAKQFAANDWYKITVKSIDSAGLAVDSLEVYLADFRDGKSLLVDDWTSFSLAPLGAAGKLTFEASSTDISAYGMNTPAYFCIDNMVICVPRKD